MKNGAVYIRVSTDKQEELSPDTQKRLILDYAKKNDIIITSDYIFTENGISGRKADKRPEFQKMIGLAKSKEKPFDCILVWKFSRFARNQEESIVYKRLLKKNNVEVVSISEPLPDGFIGELVERIFEWMDEYYSINLSGEVMRGMTENALRGGYQSYPPLGYNYVGYKKPPSVSEKDKEIILFIYKEFLDGKTVTKIARELNERGYLTQRSNLFEARTVEYILKNPFYIGMIRWNYSKRGRELKDEEEWITSKGSHEAIISQEDFDKVQEILSKRMKKRKSRDMSVCRHWASGILFCSSCGGSLSFSKAVRNNKRANFFQCWRYTKALCEKSHYISEENVIENIIFGLEKTVLSDKIPYQVTKKTADDNNEMRLLEEMIMAINKKEDRIRQSYRNGIDTLEEYAQNKEILKKEKESIEFKLNKFNASLSIANIKENDKEMIKNINDVLAILKSDENDFEQKGNAIRSIVNKIVFNKDSCKFDFYFYL